MDLIAPIGGMLLPAIVSVSFVAVVALGIEWLSRHSAPPLRVALLRVALVKFALPGLGLALLPSWNALASGGAATIVATSPWWAVAIAVWVAGALVAVARTARAALAVKRLVATSVPADPGATARLTALATAIGIHAPRFRASKQVAAPFVCGSMRPTIVLPAAWSAHVSGGDHDSVLLHELAHVKRGDLLWMELTALLAIVWWWHPLFHHVAARASAAQEDACDDLAVSTCHGDADDYSRALVTAAGLAARAKTPAFSAGLGARRIEHRLRRLADPLRRSTSRLSRAHLAAILALALVAALAPGRGDGAHSRAVDGVTISDHSADAHARTHQLRHRQHHRHP